MTRLNGWLLDVFADVPGHDSQEGVILWLLGDDGRRYRLRQDLAATFYAAGPAPRLRALWQYLRRQPVPVDLRRDERRELFSPQPLVVLAASVRQPAEQPALFRQVVEAFPDLAYFDADLSVPLRHAAQYETFPLARCALTVTGDRVQALRVLDTPWVLDPRPAPLRILTMEPDCDPSRGDPQALNLRCDRCTYRLTLQPERPLLINLRAILSRHDPDLLLTAWGDTWLLPRLLELERQWGIELPLSREPGRLPAHRRERSYFSYGQVIHRGQQVHLFGRWHIDRGNAMFWKDYDLAGVLEIARVTAQPVQVAARTSPGTGISAMQMLTALRSKILVPWRKQQAERPKAAAELFRTDQGGLVYQPTVGLHQDVAEIDFVSMYPGIMVRFNISPETAGEQPLEAGDLAPFEMPPGRGEQGLVPKTLSPLLEKRLALKARAASRPAWDPRSQADKARASAHKWLLVTCFGYLGYKNARFGRIEAHEAVTAYGREALLRAKEAAEEMGFTILHLYVDGLWVQKPGANHPDHFQDLLAEISKRTNLPIALDGIFRWVAFLPSRQDQRVPVCNRYFGVFQDGSLKVRGIEARRHDTCPYIEETQLHILEMLAGAGSAAVRGAAARSLAAAGDPHTRLPAVLADVRRRLSDLQARRVPLEALVIDQKLSRTLEEYRTPSPPARAAAQLQAAGRTLRPGQHVRFLYTRGEPGVRAWDLPGDLDPATVDLHRYAQLLRRAAASVLEPFGLDEAGLNLLLDAGSKLPANSALRLPAPERPLFLTSPSPQGMMSAPGLVLGGQLSLASQLWGENVLVHE